MTGIYHVIIPVDRLIGKLGHGCDGSNLGQLWWPSLCPPWLLFLPLIPLNVILSVSYNIIKHMLTEIGLNIFVKEWIYFSFSLV